MKKASSGREKTYRIVDIREQGRIFGSIPRRTLDYSRALHPSDEASIDTLTGIWRKSEATPLRTVDSLISWPSSADRYYPIQTRHAFFARNSEKQKAGSANSWPAFFKCYGSALVCQNEGYRQSKSTIGGRIPLPRRPNVPFGC